MSRRARGSSASATVSSSETSSSAASSTTSEGARPSGDGAGARGLHLLRQPVEVARGFVHRLGAHSPTRSHGRTQRSTASTHRAQLQQQQLAMRDQTSQHVLIQEYRHRCRRKSGRTARCEQSESPPYRDRPPRRMTSWPSRARIRCEPRRQAAPSRNLTCRTVAASAAPTSLPHRFLREPQRLRHILGLRVGERLDDLQDHLAIGYFRATDLYDCDISHRDKGDIPEDRQHPR